LITGLGTDQQGRHFQSVCARGGEQNFSNPVSLFKKVLAAAGKISVARNLFPSDGLNNVFNLLPTDVRPVKSNHGSCQLVGVFLV
ncbi:MAG TPA: hypothetical protein VK517_02170, partial [Cyclobacteriaceae bacterium]|nr:hypothetical protein [Cyclobacteriaceae bacterium]